MRYFLLALFFCLGTPADANGDLSNNIRISSAALGYDLHYRVYEPDPSLYTAPLPVIYITDGQWYLSDGHMVNILDTEITAGRIKPVLAVFVDSSDPDNPAINRRNQQFMCNARYVKFYTGELIPTIEARYAASNNPDDRVIMGLSFGGLNSACFGLMASNAFHGIAMHSPANSKHLKMLADLYKKRPTLPLKMFFSIGTIKDNTKAARKFMKVLKAKNYDLTYTEVKERHNWQNWGPLIDDALWTFFGTNQ